MKLKNTAEVKDLVIKKIREQWVSILKAYKDMNKDISCEGISPAELKFYFNHWGIKMTDEQFKEIYEWFDGDKDGTGDNANNREFLTNPGLHGSTEVCKAIVLAPTRRTKTPATLW